MSQSHISDVKKSEISKSHLRSKRQTRGIPIRNQQEDRLDNFMMETKSTETIIAEHNLQLLKDLIANGRITQQQKMEMKLYIEMMIATVQSDIDREKVKIDALKRMQIDIEREAAEGIIKEINNMKEDIFGKKIVIQDRKTKEFYKINIRDFASLDSLEVAKAPIEPEREKC